ncbi:MAG: Sulfoxide reductase heme-binding subunit YedZ [Pseudomonadota bacterium]|jgi:sulfoxide reductase heme-binding subunit YedZ
MRAWLRTRSAWWALLAITLLPLASLVWRTWHDDLGANPAETLIRATGDWALRGLCLALAVTPLRWLLGWPEIARFRRMLGLMGFGYALLHLLCYALFDMALDVGEIARDIAKRPFILVGFITWLILLPLAATSFNRAIRWLGAARWQMLHRAVYGAAALAVLHFWWMRSAKNNLGEPLLYGAIVALLLAWRWHKRLKNR